MNPAVPTWAGVAASLALVAAAVAVAWRQRLHLAREITIAAACARYPPRPERNTAPRIAATRGRTR